MKSLLFISTLAFLGFKLFSCSKVFPDDTFSLIKTLNISKKIKLNGYFYKGDETQIYVAYFFFENGVILNTGGSPSSGANSFIELEKTLLSASWRNSLMSNKAKWGLYEIKGDEIKFERFYPSSGGPLPAYIRSGKILNDTTFIITQSMRSNGTEISKQNEIYHFRAFGPKPDSTNNFIK